ncbi:Casein kinase I [Tritrichomonas foetus]|uniref:Casein kinase I n=1 Tax=Tritrichomonas foetus TaxID=1144522 RepID=A0A1J4JX42_9EUKA|nr:Casein kinase I [Tritrichomonas foetus]|eukprot:OHT01845.1 Casein kinase I [Tritrichomonas foetus]
MFAYSKNRLDLKLQEPRSLSILQCDDEDDSFSSSSSPHCSTSSNLRSKMQNGQKQPIIRSKSKSCLSKSLKYSSSKTIYQIMDGTPGFPRVKHRSTKHVVLESLGLNISSVVDELKHLSLKTVLIIADQLLCRLESLHSKGYIHCDIRPDVLMTGKRDSSNVIYLMNLNHAAPYIVMNNSDSETDSIIMDNPNDSSNDESLNNNNIIVTNEISVIGEHVPFTDKNPFSGSLAFASTNAHRGFQLSRRDDLESLAYVLIYLLNGSLPWMTFARPADVLYSKMNIPAEDLCGGIPKVFKKFLNHVRCLSFEDRPKYAEYRKLFRELFIKKGYLYDYRFEWSSIVVSRSLDLQAARKSSAKAQKNYENFPKRKSKLIKGSHHQIPKPTSSSKSKSKSKKQHRLLIYPSK